MVCPCLSRPKPVRAVHLRVFRRATLAEGRFDRRNLGWMKRRACFINFSVITRSIDPRAPVSMLSRRFVCPFTPVRLLAGLACASVASPQLFSAAADNADLQALRAQVQALEQQLRVLSRQIELKEEAAAAPKVSITDRGYSFSSADTVNFI